MAQTSRSFALAVLLAGVLTLASYVWADAPLLPGNNAPAQKKFSGRTVDLKNQVLRPGRGTIVLTLSAPKGYHFTEEAPCKFTWVSHQDSVVKFLKAPKEFDFKKAKFPLSLPVSARAGETYVTVDAELYLCEDASKVCMPDNVRLTLPIKVSSSGKQSVTVAIEAEPPSTLDW